MANRVRRDWIKQQCVKTVYEGKQKQGKQNKNDDGFFFFPNSKAAFSTENKQTHAAKLHGETTKSSAGTLPEEFDIIWQETTIE